ncbi:hypothetical protein V6R21_23750 [Limibacter armeniacum]|uniref:hypothetical protein n=1 Tax=Limibacter armeniacum TaxID=466084 RepID=UPI002FE5569A
MNPLKIEKACDAARDKLSKLNKEGEYAKIVADLEWVLGSYKHDGNPEGLYEKGAEASQILKEIRKDKPRAVAKTLVESLDKAVAEQN